MTPSTDDPNYPERTTLAGLPDEDYFGEGEGRIKDTDLAAWLGHDLDALRSLLTELYRNNFGRDPVTRDGAYYLDDTQALIVTGRLVGDDDGEAGKAFPALSKAISDRRFVRPEIWGEDRHVVASLPRHDAGDGIPRILASELAKKLGYEEGPGGVGYRLIMQALINMMVPGEGHRFPRMHDDIVMGDSGELPLPDCLISTRDALTAAALIRSGARHWLTMDAAERPKCWWLPVPGHQQMFIDEHQEIIAEHAGAQ